MALGQLAMSSCIGHHEGHMLKQLDQKCGATAGSNLSLKNNQQTDETFLKIFSIMSSWWTTPEKGLAWLAVTLSNYLTGRDDWWDEWSIKLIMMTINRMMSGKCLRVVSVVSNQCKGGYPWHNRSVSTKELWSYLFKLPRGSGLISHVNFDAGSRMELIIDKWIQNDTCHGQSLGSYASMEPWHTIKS